MCLWTGHSLSLSPVGLEGPPRKLQCSLSSGSQEQPVRFVSLLLSPTDWASGIHVGCPMDFYCEIYLFTYLSQDIDEIVYLF